MKAPQECKSSVRGESHVHTLELIDAMFHVHAIDDIFTIDLVWTMRHTYTKSIVWTIASVLGRIAY